MGCRRAARAFTITEVLVALVVLLIGVVGVVNVFPAVLSASFEASMKSKAAMLAEMKVAELRRDANQPDSLIRNIAGLTAPTTPVPFPADDRLSYSFSGVSLLYPTVDPSNPATAVGVPRIIVRYNASFRPSADVLYELRFLGPSGP